MLIILYFGKCIVSLISLGLTFENFYAAIQNFYENIVWF